MLTKKSALSYAKFNIRVTSIQPGAIATEMSGIFWDDLEDSTIISSRKKLQPLHRMGHPYDVAYAALFFASDDSAFVTVQHFWWMAELVQSTDCPGTNCHLHVESTPQLS